MNSNQLVGWLVENIPLHLEWCKTFNPGDETREEVLRNWIMWGLNWGLIEVFHSKVSDRNITGNEQVPVGYIFARPCTLEMALDPQTDYFKTLFYFNGQGEVAWIDTLWAPGHYAEVLSWLRGTRRQYVAWQHKGRYYLKEIASLSGDVPIRSQIRSGLIVPQSLAPVPS